MATEKLGEYRVPPINSVEDARRVIEELAALVNRLIRVINELP